MAKGDGGPFSRFAQAAQGGGQAAQGMGQMFGGGNQQTPQNNRLMNFGQQMGMKMPGMFGGMQRPDMNAGSMPSQSWNSVQGNLPQMGGWGRGMFDPGWAIESPRSSGQIDLGGGRTPEWSPSSEGPGGLDGKAELRRGQGGGIFGGGLGRGMRQGFGNRFGVSGGYGGY